MKILRSIWQRLFIVICAFALLMAGAYYYITRTEAGLLLGWRIAAKFIPGDIKIDHLHGTVTDAITFDHFYYAIDGTIITIDKARIQADLFALARKEIIVHQLTANNVLISVPAHDPEAKPSTFTQDDLMDILAMIHIDQADVTSLAVTEVDKTLFQADSITFSRTPKNSNLIDIISANGNLSGDVAFNVDKYRHWVIALEGQHVNAGLLSPDLAGNINFKLNTDGIWSRKNHQMKINIDTFKGMIRQHPINLDGVVTYDNGKSQIDHVALHFADAVVTANGSINDPWDLQWTLDVPHFSNVIPALQGSLKSNGRIQYINKTPVISASLIATNLSYQTYKINKIIGIINSQVNANQVNASLSVKNILLTNIAVPDIELTLHSLFDSKQITATSLITFDKNNSISGVSILPAFDQISNTKLPINNQFKLNFNNLDLFNEILAKIPQIKSVKGKLGGNVLIKGSIDKPELSSVVELQDASLLVPQYNTQLSAIQIKALYNIGEELKIDGSFNIGSGRGTVNGTADFKEGPQTNIKLKGSDLQVANTSEYKIKADPDLTVSYKNNALSLEGSINIPSADIHPTDFSTSVTQSNDVIIVNNKEANSTPLNLNLALQINLGNKFNLKVKDLQTKLTGQLQIYQTPGNLPKATGVLKTIDGTYTAYGQELTIQTGRIIYTGNVITRPGIDVKAIKQLKSVSMANQSQFSNASSDTIYAGTDTLTVGVWIRGTIEKPLTTFFSDPPGLVQGDILSYLILGQPQSQASGTSSLALLNMAASQYGGGTGNVTNKIQDKLGLSDLSVGSTEYYDSTSNTAESTTTVNVGKDLGHHLSIHYSVGIFSSISILNLRYQISKHFALQSETSTLENGGDLLYQIEGGE